MRRFNVDKELNKLDRSRFVTSNKKSIMSVLMPFFVIGFSCCALSIASYSLDGESIAIEEVNDKEKEIIISEKDENVINDDFGISKYYLNNDIKYVNINNMIFRLIRINGNGSYRIMLEYDLPRDYSLNIQDNLKNWFNSNFNNSMYVVKNTYDNNIYIGDEEVTDLMNLSSARFDYVGLLSYREYKLIYQYDDNSSFFLESYDISNNRWCSDKGILNPCTDDENYGIRPVINIKVSKFSGEGTLGNPYVIEE